MTRGQGSACIGVLIIAGALIRKPIVLTWQVWCQYYDSAEGKKKNNLACTLCEDFVPFLLSLCTSDPIQLPGEECCDDVRPVLFIFFDDVVLRECGENEEGERTVYQKFSLMICLGAFPLCLGVE